MSPRVGATERGISSGSVVVRRFSRGSVGLFFRINMDQPCFISFLDANISQLGAPQRRLSSEDRRVLRRAVALVQHAGGPVAGVSIFPG